MTDAPRRVFFFGEGSAEGEGHGKDVLGGKGASLAAMSGAGLPVPPGFTISVACCREFLEAGGEWPAGLEEEVRAALARLERATGRTYGRGAEPLLVSVRSGAAVSMPGMMDTILNCGLHPALAGELPDDAGFWGTYGQLITFFGKTVAGIGEPAFEEAAAEFPDGLPDRERLVADACRAVYEREAGRPFPTDPWRALVECIEAVFRSWNTERAIVYRKHNDIRGLFGTAVNVQSMFPSRKSGIGFTVNPTAPEANEIVIESAYGLGEAVVSGDVTPDRFVLDRETLEVKQSIIGEKRAVVAALGATEPLDPKASSLSADEILELGRIALRVEDYFGFPVDFEWGWADGSFALLQSRAVRGLDIARDVEVGRREEIERLRALAGGARKVWVMHNLSETLESPTPLTWDIVGRSWMRGNGGFGRLYQDLGYQPSARVRSEGFLDLVAGRIYADVERTAQLFWESMPFEYDLEAVSKDAGLLETAPTKFNAERADGRFFVRLPRALWTMIRAARTMKRMRARTVEDFEAVLPPYFAYVHEKRAQDLTGLSTAEVLAELDARCERVLGEFGKESLKPGFFGGLARGALEASLEQLMGEELGRDLGRILTSGLEGDTTMEQNIALWRTAQGEMDLHDFLDGYGHRAVSEMELAEPRWREDTSYLEQMIGVYKSSATRSPEERHAENVERRAEAERKLPETLAEWGGASQREEFIDLMQEAQKLLPYREIGKHYLMMGYETVRLAIMELSRRWDLGRDVFYLHREELDRCEAEREALTEKIVARKRRWQSAKRLDHASIIDSNDLDKLGLPQEFEAASELEADALASGVATGTARLVFNPKEAGELGTDAILVCPSTDPGWTALFAQIKGLVVERGGALSHGAITARDFGIPAVACPDATKRIEAGARVRVDGGRGRVTILED